MLLISQSFNEVYLTDESRDNNRCNVQAHINVAAHRLQISSNNFQRDLLIIKMERWRNRVALVTGSGSGIGATIAFNLAKHGMTVIGCARNIQPIDVRLRLFHYLCVR